MAQAGGTQSGFRGVQSERRCHGRAALVLELCRSRKYSRGWASAAERSGTDGLTNNGNESRLVSEGKGCIILCNYSFWKCAEDRRVWLRLRVWDCPRKCAEDSGIRLRNGSGGYHRQLEGKRKDCKRVLHQDEKDAEVDCFPFCQPGNHDGGRGGSHGVVRWLMGG